MNNGSAEYPAYQYQFTNISKFGYYSRQVNSVNISVVINLLCRVESWELRVETSTTHWRTMQCGSFLLGFGSEYYSITQTIEKFSNVEWNIGFVLNWIERVSFICKYVSFQVWVGELPSHHCPGIMTYGELTNITDVTISTLHLVFSIVHMYY